MNYTQHLPFQDADSIIDPISLFVMRCGSSVEAYSAITSFVSDGGKIGPPRECAAGLDGWVRERSVFLGGGSAKL